MCKKLIKKDDSLMYSDGFIGNVNFDPLKCDELRLLSFPTLLLAASKDLWGLEIIEIKEYSKGKEFIKMWKEEENRTHSEIQFYTLKEGQGHYFNDYNFIDTLLKQMNKEFELGYKP